MKKRFALALSISMIAILVTASLVNAGPGIKLAVCHIDELGVYHLINISENAFPAHVEHGDWSPGDDVPGMPGYVFGENCSAEIYGVSGTWEGVSGAGVYPNPGSAFPFTMYLTQLADNTVTGWLDYGTYPSCPVRHLTGYVSGDTLHFDIYEPPCYTYNPAYITGTVVGNSFSGTGYQSSTLIYLVATKNP